MSRPKRMNPFVVKLEQEPEEQRRKTEGSLNKASASSVTDGETNRIACLEAEVAAKAAEIEQKDAEIAALKAEVKWLQSDRVTPQQMLEELERLRSSINDACILAASANQQRGSTPPSVLPSPPLLLSQQAQVHFEDGCRLCAPSCSPKPYTLKPYRARRKRMG